MNFDIAALEAATTRTFDLKVGERDDGSPVGFRLLGPSSEQYLAAEREVKIFVTKESAARNKRIDVSTDEGAATVVDGGDRSRDLIISRCVVDIFGFTEGEDKPLPFTPENLERILRAMPAWRDTIYAAIENEANFSAG